MGAAEAKALKSVLAVIIVEIFISTENRQFDRESCFVCCFAGGGLELLEGLLTRGRV